MTTSAIVKHDNQVFCSFLCIAGAEQTGDDAPLANLPTSRKEVSLYRYRAARLYLSLPIENPLHRYHIGGRGDFLCFLQGDFYEDTDPSLLMSVIPADGPIDQEALAEYLRTLNGAFSGFILDVATNEVYGFNDRFGFGHAYVTVAGDARMISSHLWPSLTDRRWGGDWDAAAFQEIILIGYPLADRCAVKNTRIVQPALIMRAGRQGVSHHSYHDYHRQNDARRRDFVQEFSDVAADHFASIRQLTGWDNYGTALSGGHDSRVIVNAMVDSEIRPYCCTGYDNILTWDAERGGKVAAAAGCEYDVIDYHVSAEQEFIDANVLADGAGTVTWSMNLAKKTAEHASCLYFGTSGGPVSGGWKVIPSEYGDLPSMVVALINSFYYEYGTPLPEFLKNFDGLTEKSLLERFLPTFGPADIDLTTAFLLNFYREGNFRRVRMFMQGASLYLPAIHFFHDLRIYNYYSRLPDTAIRGQRVHNRLCYYAVPAHARIPGSNFFIPVALATNLLPFVRKLSAIGGLRSKLRRFTRKSLLIRAVEDAPTLETLAASAADIGIDIDRLRATLEQEEHSGLLLLRMKYAATMLKPSTLLENSRFVGKKHVVERQIQAAD